MEHLTEITQAVKKMCDVMFWVCVVIEQVCQLENDG